MTRTGHEAWDERGDTAAEALEAPTFDRRHLLLGGAVGGFTLAASGLVLPEWLVEEAEAGKHPVRRMQQRKEHKREKNRNQNQGKRRTHGDKKDKPLGGPWVPAVAIAVHNYRKSAVRLRGWQVSDPNGCGPGCAKWEMPTVWNWRELPAWTGGNQHAHTEFVSARDHVAVQIGDSHAVEAKISYAGNGSPMKGYMDAWILIGEWGTYGVQNGGPVASDTKMWVNDSIRHRGYGIFAKNVGIADSGHTGLSVDLWDV